MRRTFAVVRFLLIIAMTFCLWPSTYGALGPFEIASSDSSTVLRLQLAGQYQSVWESKDKGSDRDKALFMRARRIRPTLTVSLPEYRASFRLHLSAAPGSLELMDMYFNTGLTSQFQLRLGQYKIPFTRYRIQSFQRLTFVDWPVVTKYFGAERQVGLSVHNGYEKPPRFAYALGVFSGENARASHATGLASAFGEEILNPSDLSGSSPRPEFHPELVCHLAFNGCDIDIRTDSDAEGGRLRYSAATSIAWDLDPVEYQDLALRVAQEFLLKYRHGSVMGVGYVGFTDIEGSLRTRKAMTGLLLQAAYRITLQCEISLRYALVDIDNNLADAALARAEAIIAGTDDNAVITQYGTAGKVLREQEATIGFNVYLDGHSFKIQNDLGVSRHDRRDEDRTDCLVRSQVQLAF